MQIHCTINIRSIANMILKGISNNYFVGSDKHRASERESVPKHQINDKLNSKRFSKQNFCLYKFQLFPISFFSQRHPNPTQPGMELGTRFICSAVRVNQIQNSTKSKSQTNPNLNQIQITLQTISISKVPWPQIKLKCGGWHSLP